MEPVKLRNILLFLCLDPIPRISFRRTYTATQLVNDDIQEVQDQDEGILTLSEHLILSLPDWRVLSIVDWYVRVVEGYS